jgi:hypothetical protein
MERMERRLGKSVKKFGLPERKLRMFAEPLGEGDIQGADNKLGQFLSPDIWATANYRNFLRHSLESCESLV